jgi:hypothetical protein
VALPGAYAHASIALRVIGAHKTPLHDMAVVHEEEISLLLSINCFLPLFQVSALPSRRASGGVPVSMVT